MTGWPFLTPDSLEDRLLGWRRVKDMTGLSRSTAWRLAQTGAFPAPVRISTHRVAWRESELMAWKVAKLRDIGEPVSSALRPARTKRPAGCVNALPGRGTKPDPDPDSKPKAKLKPESETKPRTRADPEPRTVQADAGRDMMKVQPRLDLQVAQRPSLPARRRRRPHNIDLNQADFGF